MARKKHAEGIPTLHDLLIPTVKSLQLLGGSGSVEEINNKVYDLIAIPEEISSIPHGTDGRSEVDYRLAWAKTYLKKNGILENSARRIWSLTN